MPMELVWHSIALSASQDHSCLYRMLLCSTRAAGSFTPIFLPASGCQKSDRKKKCSCVELVNELDTTKHCALLSKKR